MPCMGPDMTGARKEGEKLGETLFNELVERYHIFDVTDPRYDKMFMIPGARKRWKRNKYLFIRLVGKIFEENEANSF